MNATQCKKHPTKIRHETKRQALEHIRQLEARGWGNPDYNAYHCSCGGWHVGHSVVKFEKRIRAALKGGRR